MSDSGALRERMLAEGLDPSAWSNGPGDRYASHDHGYDKIIVVAAGSIRFGLHDRSIDLEAGDRLELPAGVTHDADVGSTGVTCLEAHVAAGTLPAPMRHPAGTW